MDYIPLVGPVTRWSVNLASGPDHCDSINVPFYIFHHADDNIISANFALDPVWGTPIGLSSNAENLYQDARFDGVNWYHCYWWVCGWWGCSYWYGQPEYLVTVSDGNVFKHVMNWVTWPPEGEPDLYAHCV